jgi:hypothetical protein
MRHTSKDTTRINASARSIQSADQASALTTNASLPALLTTTTDCTLTTVIVPLMPSVLPNIATTPSVHPLVPPSPPPASTLMAVPVLAMQSAIQATASHRYVPPTAQPRPLVLTLTHASAQPTQSVPPTSAIKATANHLACPTKPTVHS